MNTPQNAMQVAEHLAGLSKDLDKLVKDLGEADHIATVLREEYIKDYAATWKNTVGSLEARKQMTLSLTHEKRLAAEVADSHVRDLRRKVDALKVRIDVGRSYGAAVRAEVSLAQTPHSPWA